MKDRKKWQAPQSKLRERLAQAQNREQSYSGDYSQDYRQNHFESIPAALLKQLRENMFQKTVAAIIVVICLGLFSILNQPLTNRVVDTVHHFTVYQMNPADLVEKAKPVMQSIRDFSWFKGTTQTPPVTTPTTNTPPEEMSAPVNGTLASPYGMRTASDGKTTEMHYGIDVTATAGSPVYAAFAGTVTLVKEHELLGTTVYIQHADDAVTIYGRVSDVKVAAGAKVTKGQEIAKVTAVTTGDSHLHFEVWQEKQPIDPETLLDQTN